MITMRQRPLETTRTADRSSVYEAECEVDGQCYSARSRNGAPNELARVLVAAGIPDQPVESHHAGIKGWITYRSLHQMARWSYREGTRRVQRVRWLPPPDYTAVFGTQNPKTGGEPTPQVPE
jgi:hypothetical protein